MQKTKCDTWKETWHIWSSNNGFPCFTESLLRWCLPHLCFCDYAGLSYSCTFSESTSWAMAMHPVAEGTKKIKIVICERLSSLHIFGLASLLPCSMFWSLTLSPACTSWITICCYSMWPSSMLWDAIDLSSLLLLHVGGRSLPTT